MEEERPFALPDDVEFRAGAVCATARDKEWVLDLFLPSAVPRTGAWTPKPRVGGAPRTTTSVGVCSDSGVDRVKPGAAAVKPSHMGAQYASQFAEQSVVAAYAHRPPIPAAVFGVLHGLIAGGLGESRTLLDAGCGTGAVARALAPGVERVDAVDFSAAMLEAGRRLPGGDRPNIHWIHAGMEDAPLDPPYGLIVAAGSLHWMEWGIVLPRFRDALHPGGCLAIVWQTEGAQPWSGALDALRQRYSAKAPGDQRPYGLLGELARRDLFRERGRHTTAPEPFAQPIASYVEALHSRDGLSRERMGADAAAAFDDGATGLLERHCHDGLVRLEITGHVAWGDPAPQTRAEDVIT